MAINEVCEVLIFNDKKQILLQLRDDKPEIHGSSRWGVIGGAKESHEKPIDCLRREVQEELGLELKSIFVATIEDSDGENIYRHHIYSAHYNEIKNLFLQEGQEIRFFNLSEIAKLNKVAWFDKIYSAAINKIVLS